MKKGVYVTKSIQVSVMLFHCNLRAEVIDRQQESAKCL